MVSLSTPFGRLCSTRWSGDCGANQLDGDARERLDVGHGDVLVRRMDRLHAAREVEALQATLVEDVRVCPTTRLDHARLAACCEQRGAGEGDDGRVVREPVGRVLTRLSQLD